MSINNELVKKIKLAVGDLDCKNNIYYNFVEDKNIDKTKTYITYSKYSSTPDYKIFLASSVFDISVFSNKLSTASSVRDTAAKYLAGIENEETILETNIEETKDLYDDVSKMHQALLTIRILHIIN